MEDTFLITIPDTIYRGLCQSQMPFELIDYTHHQGVSSLSIQQVLPLMVISPTEFQLRCAIKSIVRYNNPLLSMQEQDVQMLAHWNLAPAGK